MLQNTVVILDRKLVLHYRGTHTVAIHVFCDDKLLSFVYLLFYNYKD